VIPRADGRPDRLLAARMCVMMGRWSWFKRSVSVHEYESEDELDGGTPMAAARRPGRCGRWRCCCDSSHRQHHLAAGGGGARGAAGPGGYVYASPPLSNERWPV
jgi:hypothetical protein